MTFLSVHDVNHLNEGHFQFNEFTTELLSMDSRIGFDPKLSADYRPSKTHIVFGAGLLVLTGYHELAHMIEMQDESRLTVDDWGWCSTQRNCISRHPLQ